MIGKYQAARVREAGRRQGQGAGHDVDDAVDGGQVGRSRSGAAIGLVFPPALVATAAEGAAIGALAGNLSKGWFKGDVKRLADQLQPGQAGIVAVAEAGAGPRGDRACSRRRTKTEKEHVTGADAEQDQGAARERADGRRRPLIPKPRERGLYPEVAASRGYAAAASVPRSRVKLAALDEMQQRWSARSSRRPRAGSASTRSRAFLVPRGGQQHVQRAR